MAVELAPCYKDKASEADKSVSCANTHTAGHCWSTRGVTGYCYTAVGLLNHKNLPVKPGIATGALLTPAATRNAVNMTSRVPHITTVVGWCVTRSMHSVRTTVSFSPSRSDCAICCNSNRNEHVAMESTTAPSGHAFDCDGACSKDQVNRTWCTWPRSCGKARTAIIEKGLSWLHHDESALQKMVVQQQQS